LIDINIILILTFTLDVKKAVVQHCLQQVQYRVSCRQRSER